MGELHEEARGLKEEGRAIRRFPIGGFNGGPVEGELMELEGDGRSVGAAMLLV